MIITKCRPLTIIASLIAAVGFFCNFDNAFAIDTTLTVSPMEQKMTLYPGESATGSVKVSNQASATENLYYKVSAVPFTRTGDGYNPIVGSELGNGSYNNIIDWITFSSESGSLSPNETDEIIYNINVPENARGGGQYFAILVTRVEGSDEEYDGNMTLKEVIQVASTVYVTITGNDIKLSGSITDNYISSVFLAPPIKGTFMVENTGNTHLEVYYYMQVFPFFTNEEIYTNEESPSYAIILPETNRFITQEWNETPQIGIFRVRQVVSYNSESDDKSIIERTVIVCPIWLLFLVVFAIVAIILWLVMRSKSRKKRAA